MADYGQLSRLTKRADAVAATAGELVARAIREIRGELANLSGEFDLAGSADDRERAYAMVRGRMARLSRRLNALLAAQSQAAARGAAKSASEMTGLEVRYSAKRAEAICELVTPSQGESLAAVFTDRMGRGLIDSLREATVAAMRSQAVAGGTMEDLARDMAERWREAAKTEDPRFVDASGRTWDTRTYFQMNVRTNTMRVYNDCLADDVARETGSDIMRISRHGSDPHCACAAWEGCIISLTGKTKGLPTYEDARRGGCFHPNCVHTLDYVDEDVDADEIALQMAHPVSGEGAADPDAQDERRYEIDQARKRAENPGMTKEAARVAVDRDNLEAAIRCGLVRGDAAELVAKMTDAQVTALCPDGNPPRFEPVKRVRGGTRKEPKYEPERWNRGRRGGVVHVARDADAQRLLEVAKIDSKGGVISTIASAAKKVAKKIAVGKPVESKTPDEIKAMKIEDAIKEMERSVSDIASMQVPDAIAIREKRLERAEQVRKARKSQYDAINDEIKALSRRQKKAQGQELADIQELLAKAKDRKIKAALKWNAAYILKKRIKAKLMAECAPWAGGIIAHGKEACTINTASVSKGLPLWNDAKSYLEKIVDRSVFPSDALTVRKISGRAYQQQSKICLSDEDPVQTHIHEAMHFIEEKNPHVHDRCVEFLRYRTKDEPKKSLKRLTGLDYDNDEYARPDNFFNPYCGKAYERWGAHGDVNVTATEILSMGVERLMQNPVRFLREDREYATMCLTLIRGSL